MPAFKIKNLKYKNILNIKNLEIPKNKITIVHGKSGVGKSTLFSLLTCKDYNYEGDIYLNNNTIKNIPIKKIFEKIVFLDQNYILLEETINEEFKAICKLLEINYDKKEISNLLKFVDLKYDISASTTKFSGGETQRLAIARTLYTNREIILLDEPTSALDSETTKTLMDNLSEYSKIKNKTIIMISHNKNIIESDEYNHIDLGEYNG